MNPAAAVLAAPVDALLVTAAGCPHCPGVRHAVEGLKSAGELGSLTLLDAQEHAAAVAELELHSVPWLRLGWMVFEGVHSAASLAHWARQARDPLGAARYFDFLFSAGRRHLVARLVRRHPHTLDAFVHLMGDPEVGINTRLGIGVVLEELVPEGLANPLVPGLGALTRHPDARLRGDAAHYLSLIPRPDVEAWLRPLCSDSHQDVRDIACEALDEIHRIQHAG
ncbi:MAG: HEAT repeat domain-containing protein [Magnetococcus sp. WYHC-3]